MPVGDAAPATVAEALAAGVTTYSFEFMPPRGPNGEALLWHAIRDLEPLGPSFVCVTYGAGGSTRDRTVRTTSRIASETTMLPVGHLTLVEHSVRELRHVIGSYAAAGVRNLLALRGDPSAGPQAPWEAHPDGLSYAAELVRLIGDLGDFCVGVAAFPETHPRATSSAADIDNFVAKVDCGADFAITQMLFDADPYFRFRDELDARGCTVPVLPGIMPVTQFRQLQRFRELSNARVPEDLTAAVTAAKDDASAVEAIGIDHATGVCRKLLLGGAPGLHLYTLNRSSATRELYRRLAIPRPALSQPAPAWGDRPTWSPLIQHDI